MAEIKYIYEKEKKRLVAMDGDREAGFASYCEGGDCWILDHTFVDPSYGGRGIAKNLIRKLADEAESREIKIMPVCSFAVKEFNDKEEEYRNVWRR
jgi:predicted GNAT family acetyltransferase